MNLVRKLNTLVRSVARESAESVIDVNQIRIFEQEIHDMEQGLGVAKRQLAEVMAQRLQLERESKAAAERIAAREEQVRRALNERREAAAQALAQDIVAVTRSREDCEGTIALLRQREDVLVGRLKRAAGQLQYYRRQLALARSVDASQRATSRLEGSAAALGCEADGLEQTLARILRNQALADDRLDAAVDVERALQGELAQVTEAMAVAASAEQVSAVIERLRGGADPGGAPAGG